MFLAASVGSVEFRYLVLVDLKDFSACTSSNLFQIARRHLPLLRRRWIYGHLVGAGEWGTRCCSTAIAVNKDLEMPQRFMSCSSPYEAWSVHVGFLQKTITDYQKELTALAKLGVVKLPTRGE